MKKLNNLVLEVNKLTGGTVDKNRDWEITSFLPNLEKDLLNYAKTIKDSYLEWQEINHSNKNTYISTALKRSYEKLEKLALEPNKIPARIGQISGNSGSLIESLGLVLPMLLNSPLSIDKVYVHSEEMKLPKANANPFSSFWVSVKRFFLSFFVDSNISKKTSDTLEVWVARSRQYVDLMQRKVDEKFTDEFGIKVNISMMPSQDKLILANSAGNQPDIAIGVDAWRPYEFAIRNAVVDLKEFDNFSTVASRFARGGFLQLIYDKGVYALPDTQNFQLLFYRKDIMDNLALPVPNTWQEVISILPELQRYGMNFYVNLAATGAFKGFGATMPFIYQYGGSIYSKDAFSAAINDPKSIEAITFMTELFTVYALPVEVGSFYNSFRNGELPIGIGDFGMYVQLLHAAPEIAGLWEIAAMPGIEYDGVINRSFVGAASSNMIFKDSKHQEAAWNFLEWWSRTDVQIDYAESLIATMGPSYMWNTATKEAFRQYSWDESHKDIILSQWEFAYDVPKIPGSYMLEREISNIWNKTVYQGTNVRSAIEDGLIVANKEIIRKMIEFGYLDQNGNVLKPYLLPTIETIGWWIDE
jgi:ABC-type glycerol-3-phosphate transport system substrate-binding protein